MNFKQIKNYFALTKPGILTLVLVTTSLGFFLAKKEISSWGLFISLLIGASLTCAGAAALNHYLERDVDCKMKRTRNRPLPLGLITPSNALCFGIILILTGIILLCWKVNLLTAFLSLLTAFLYVLVYTPMKRISWINTTIGAIPGAIPPLGGWAAATGELSTGAWILFLIMFLWQHPHFYSIAWLCKEDYKQAGFKMLPVVDPDGKSTFRQIILFAFLLIPISLMPSVIGLSGIIYFWGALAIGIYMLWTGIALKLSHSNTDARQLLKASIYYLPVLFFFLILDIALL